jgi:Tol biopolymer transport system component
VLWRVWRGSLILTLGHLGLLLLMLLVGAMLGGDVIALSRDTLAAAPHLALRDLQRGLDARIVYEGDFHSLPIWSPDGAWLAWLRGGSVADWLLLRWDDLTVRPLAGSLPSGTMLAWSPDARQIVFERTTASGERRLMIVDVAGGTPQTLPNSPGLDQSAPSWSPDGRWIAYQMQAEDRISRVVRYDLLAERSETLPRDGAFYPTWSPSGGALAYVVYNDRERALGLYQLADGRERVYPFDEPLDFSPPQWSPDGRYVAFGQGASQIWLLDTHTEALTRLTPPTRFQYAPQWSPDGRALLVTELGIAGQFSAVTLIAVPTAEQRLLTPQIAANERMPTWKP